METLPWPPPIWRKTSVIKKSKWYTNDINESQNNYSRWKMMETEYVLLISIWSFRKCPLSIVTNKPDVPWGMDGKGHMTTFGTDENMWPECAVNVTRLCILQNTQWKPLCTYTSIKLFFKKDCSVCSIVASQDTTRGHKTPPDLQNTLFPFPVA